MKKDIIKTMETEYNKTLSMFYDSKTTENKTYYNGVLIGMESMLNAIGYCPVYQDHATVTIIKAGK